MLFFTRAQGLGILCSRAGCPSLWSTDYRKMHEECLRFIVSTGSLFKAINLPGEAPNLDSLSAFLNMSSSDGI